MAHSSERAAAMAYQGHARSVRREEEREGIARIELDEWVHRDGVRRMLVKLGAGPARWREIAMGGIGRALRALCRVSGWHLPMLCAWKLEEMNVGEYAEAARLAREAGEGAMAVELERMSSVEAEHAAFFRGVLLGRTAKATAAILGE
jgi:rubrerythrin